MYQVIHENEQPVSISVDDVKLFIGISHTVEDGLIQNFINSAMNFAETLTNNVFRAKRITILTSAGTIFLPGKITGEVEVTDAKTDGTIAFERIGNTVVIGGSSEYVKIVYNTAEWLPADVKTFVYQACAKMYERGTEVVVEPDMKLLSRYQIYGLC